MDGGIVVKHICEEEHFAASDGCMLAEVLHPARAALPFGGYSLAHAYIEPRCRTVPHTLKNSAETYVVLSGTGTLHADGETVPLRAGVCAAVPRGAEQYVVNDGEERLEFLCIVTPPWSGEDEEITQPRQLY